MKDSLPNDISITTNESVMTDIGEITLTTSAELLDQMIKLVPFVHVLVL